MEDAGTLRVVGVAGSLRQASYNRALLRAAQELAPERLKIEIHRALEMKPSRKAGLLLVALVALAVACTRQSKPLAVPELAEVDHIYVSQSKDSSMVWKYENSDRGRIAAILDHL